MERALAVIASFTARQHGVVARAQLLAAGVPPHLIDDRVRAGDLVTVHPGVYRHAAVPFSTELRWMAALLAGGDGAALSHRAAAVLHGMAVRRTRPEILVTHSRQVALDDVTVHRSRRIDEIDVAVVRGFRATARPRTLLELGAVLRGEPYVEVVQDAVIRKLVTVESLVAVLDRLGTRGRTGTGPLREALLGGFVDPTIESKLELLLAKITEGVHGPKPVRQYELRCVDGRIVRFDVAWPAIQLGVDADGLRWHGSATQARRTRERARSIERSSWSHLVYGWGECHDTPDAVRREIEQTVLDLLRRAA